MSVRVIVRIAGRAEQGNDGNGSEGRRRTRHERDETRAGAREREIQMQVIPLLFHQFACLCTQRVESL